MPQVPVNVIHETEQRRFFTHVEHQFCQARYVLLNGTMHLTHTAVPAALQGRGIAATLVAAALAHARSQGWRVRPVCSYVQAYMQRHPETQDLLETR